MVSEIYESMLTHFRRALFGLVQGVFVGNCFGYRLATLLMLDTN